MWYERRITGYPIVLRNMDYKGDATVVKNWEDIYNIVVNQQVWGVYNSISVDNNPHCYNMHIVRN